MIEIYKKTIKNKVLENTQKITNGSWVFVVDPDEKEIKFLEKNLKLKKGHILDALDYNETPRLEVERSDVYIFLRFPFQEHGRIKTMPVLFVLTDDFVITVAKNYSNLFEDFFKEKIEFYTTQRRKFLLSVFLKINLLYKGHLNAINKNIRSKESNLKKITDKDIVDFVEAEKIFNDFISSLIPTTNIYKTLSSREYLNVFKEDQELVEDLWLSTDEAINISKTSLRAIVNIREAYTAIMTNSLNKTIKFLTAVTIVLTFPMIIASFYGMNVNLPLQGSNFAFHFILGFSILASLFIVFIFYRKNWM